MTVPFSGTIIVEKLYVEGLENFHNCDYEKNSMKK
jgi:hypothetical protein